MPQVDTVSARHINSPFASADLDHPAWNSSEPILITRLWSGEKAPSGSHAEVRLLWTNHALLAKFVCNQSQPPVINQMPRLNKKTLGLCDRDVCEVFLAPFPEHPAHYFEFE